MELTESVRSFQVPPTPFTSAWPPSLPSVPTSRATRVTSRGERVELVHHGVDGVLQLQNFAAHIHRDLAREIAVGHGRGDFGDVTDLIGQVAGHGVHGVGKILPDAADAFHFRLAAELAFRTDFARHARHFAGERVELIHHRVDGVLQLQNFAAHVHRDLARKIAVGDGRGDLGDITNLAVRLPAMELTESVRSFQTPPTPFTSAWPPSLPSVPTSRATRVTSRGERS